MYEPCEASGKCNVDQRSFKAYLTRCLAATAALVPYLHDSIIKEIRTSALAAAKTCTAGNTGTNCGLRWTLGNNDGSLGVGEQMAALEIFQSNLVDSAKGWVSAAKGTGSSEGDVDAGTSAPSADEKITVIKITSGDKVGAGILTAMIILGVIGGTATMMIAE